MVELAGVLPHDQVFELQDVDRASVDLAMDQPGQVAVAEFTGSVRFRRSQRFLASGQADDVFGGRANPVQLRVRFPLALVIQQDDQVEVAQPGQFTHGLVHEHAAAVHGRTDRVGRYEQNRQARGIAAAAARNVSR